MTEERGEDVTDKRILTDEEWAMSRHDYCDGQHPPLAAIEANLEALREALAAKDKRIEELEAVLRDGLALVAEAQRGVSAARTMEWQRRATALTEEGN